MQLLGGPLENLIERFKSMKTAYATIKGFEVMRMFKKGQMSAWMQLPGIKGEIYLVEKQFGIYNTSYAQQVWSAIENALNTA